MEFTISHLAYFANYAKFYTGTVIQNLEFRSKIVEANQNFFAVCIHQQFVWFIFEKSKIEFKFSWQITDLEYSILNFEYPIFVVFSACKHSGKNQNSYSKFNTSKSMSCRQVVGSLFAPSQKSKKLSHHFWVCFELVFGILNVHAKYFWRFMNLF